MVLGILPTQELGINLEEGAEIGCWYESELRLVGRDGLEETNVSNFVCKCSINGDNPLLAQFRYRSNVGLGRSSSVLCTRM